MSKPKKQVFSKIKAVKANARARVGTPPPERVLPDPKQKLDAKPFYPQRTRQALDNLKQHLHRKSGEATRQRDELEQLRRDLEAKRQQAGDTAAR
mgnify:CR=1 FL=1